MWTAHLLGTPQLDTHMAASINGKVYSFHSSHEDGIRNIRNYVDVFTFDPASLRWNSVQTQLPDERRIDIKNCAVVAHGPCAYLWGGTQSWPSETVLYRFDTSTLTWSRPEVSGEAPTPFYGNSACVVGQSMYAFGFMSESDDVRFLHLDTMEWHRVPARGTVPDKPFFDITPAIGTRIYVWPCNLAIPLHANEVACDHSLYYLETTTSTWVRPRVQGVPPVGRRGHSAFVYNREMYIFGGYSSLLGTYLADIHKYDPETSRWTEVKTFGSGPSPRYWHGCSATGERVFVFGGLGPVRNLDKEEVARKEEVLTDAHILHLAPTLQNLCLLAVMDARLNLGHLPTLIRAMIETFR